MHLNEPGTEKANDGDLATALIEFVHGRDHVSFVEIQRFLEPYMSVKGDAVYGIAEMNIAFWAGMSDELIDLLNTDAVREGIVPEAASPLCYLIDGGMLNLPIAKRPPKNGYKEMHWAPAVFRSRERAG